MIEERALVVALEDGKALLEVVRDQPCGLCGQSRGCGGSLWSRLVGSRNSMFRAENRVNAQTGDLVVVGVDEGALLRGSVLAYGVPLMLLLAGAAMGGAVFSARLPHDAAALLGALAGLASGLWWLRRHSAGTQDDPRYRAVILRAAEPGIVHRVCHRGE